jgi:uncharacterized tellurite resistance protein B-like protein
MDLSNLTGLSKDEKLALVALLKRFVSEDGRVSENEIDAIGGVAAALGEEEYRRLVDEADERLGGDETLRAFLETITRQDARETIYEIVFEASAGEALRGLEPEMLDWLAEAWDIEVKVIDEEGS